MGENEQGGMLRNVTVLGLIAIIAAVVIFAVIGLKGQAKESIKDSVQKTDLAIYDRDLNVSIIGDNGKLTQIDSNSDAIEHGTISYLASSPEPLQRVHANYRVDEWGRSEKLDLGIFYEIFLDQQKMKWLKSDSNSDYVWISLDYKVKNAQPVSFATAKSLGLDSARDTSVEGILFGVRSDSYDWNTWTYDRPVGDKEGTITYKAPKSKEGATFEVWINVRNLNFDKLEISNVHMSNANVFG